MSQRHHAQSRQIGPRQIGPRQIGPRQIGPRQIGPRQISQRHLRWRRIYRRRRLTVAAVFFGALLVLGMGIPRLTASPPAPLVRLRFPASPGPAVAQALPWPSVGEAAIGIPRTGLVQASGPERPVPVASLTKIMTAVVVLQDHPLAPGQSGPRITMTAADVADSARLAAQNATIIPIQTGERLSERQLLAGLLVRSANDFADALARWDAGSLSAFVERMNQEARQLDLHQTHYADPSGVSSRSVSTAVDELRLAAFALQNPVFASLVALPSVVEPLAGRLANYVSAVGHDGVVGVKSGFTQAAMGCLVLAARRQVAGRSVLFLAAVTGQAGLDPLGTAQQVALRLIGAAARTVRLVTLLHAGQQVGSVVPAWGDPAPGAVVVAGTTPLLIWPGQRPLFEVRLARVPVPARPGTQVGWLTVELGAQRLRRPLVLHRPVPGPDFLWLLAH